MKLEYVLIDVLIFVSFYVFISYIRCFITNSLKSKMSNYERNDVVLLMLSLVILLSNSYKCYCKHMTDTTLVSSPMQS